VTFYENGYKKNTKIIMPDIVDVLTYNNRVVTVKFADGTEEKAVLHPDDKFSVEQGISICIGKKLAGNSSIYNKIISHALDVKQKNENKKAEQKKREARIKEENRNRNLRRAERNRKKREKFVAEIETIVSSILNEKEL
jgi:hypothetical protein